MSRVVVDTPLHWKINVHLMFVHPFWDVFDGQPFASPEMLCVFVGIGYLPCTSND